MKETVWRNVFVQLKEAINPPICGLLLLQQGRVRLWVDIAGQPSSDMAGQLRAMVLVSLAGLTDPDVQPDQVMVELSTEGIADSTKAAAYAAHNDVRRLLTTLRFVASSREAKSLDVPALAAAFQESTMIRNALAPFNGIRFLDRQGILLYRYPEVEEMLSSLGKDYSWRRYFKQAIKGHAHYSTTLRSDFKRHLAVASIPIVGDDGTVVGVLAGALDLEGIRSFVSLPVIREGQLVGLVAIASPEEAAFGEEELRVLATLAEQALDN